MMVYLGSRVTPCGLEPATVFLWLRSPARGLTGPVRNAHPLRNAAPPTPP